VAGCTTVKPAELENGEAKYYFGFVKVIPLDTDPKIKASAFTHLGVKIGGGVSIGWGKEEEVLVPLKVVQQGGERQAFEATCSLVVIIRSGIEANHTLKTIKDLKGENICVAQF